MTIVEIISEIVASIGGGNIYFATGRPKELNIEDPTNSILCFLEEPISSTGEVRQYGQVEYNYNIRIYFLMKRPDVDSTSAQHREIIEQVRPISRAFILSVNDAKDGDGARIFYPVTTHRTDEIYNRFELALTGVLLTIQMKPYQDLSICQTLWG